MNFNPPTQEEKPMKEILEMMANANRKDKTKELAEVIQMVALANAEKMDELIDIAVKQVAKNFMETKEGLPKELDELKEVIAGAVGKLLKEKLKIDGVKEADFGKAALAVIKEGLEENS